MTQELQVPNGNSKLSGLYQRGNIEGVGRYAGFPKMQAAVSSSNQWLWEGACHGLSNAGSVNRPTYG